MIVMINSESVKRRDFDEFLESYLTELQKVMDESIAEIEARFNDTHHSITTENERMKSKIAKLEDKDREIVNKMTDGFDNTKRQWVKVMDDLNSANVYIKTVELMSRTLSSRTYSDFNEFYVVIENVQKMVTEEKDCQIKEAEAIRKILFDLNKRVDVELPEHINSSVMKVLEQVKEESIKIWEVCLTYAQKVDTKTQKGRRLLFKDSFNRQIASTTTHTLWVAKITTSCQCLENHLLKLKVLEPRATPTLTSIRSQPKS